MPYPTHQAILSWTAAMLLTLFVVYPLSYAPVVRYDRTLPIDTLPIYRPVDWLIDNSSFKQPLFAWARLWGVEGDFAGARTDRAIVRYWENKQGKSPK